MKLLASRYQRRSQVLGLTLVELMVSMALGLLLTGGAIGIFLSSKQVYRSEEALSRIQENGRFAIKYLVSTIRSAGFVGCSNLQQLTPNVVANPPPPDGFALGSAMLGYEGDGTNGTGGNWNHARHIAGTDIITIVGGGQCGSDLTATMATRDADVQIGGGPGCGFNKGNTLLITNCERADLFRVSDDPTEAGGQLLLEHGVDENLNTDANFSTTYQMGATVYRYGQSTFFVGAGDDGKPSLYRTSGGAAPQPMIENVQDLQLQYGLDTNADGAIDNYQTAAGVADWGDVLGVRINLLLRSDEDNVTMDPQRVSFNGVDVNTGDDTDRRLRMIFNTSVTIRNRTP